MAAAPTHPRPMMNRICVKTKSHKPSSRFRPCSAGCIGDNDSVPADEFREHYASLSEEGLREINRADLTDAARACYDEEVASRGLSIENAPPPEVGPPAEEIEWAPLGTFNLDEIEQVRALLDFEGIPAEREPRPPGNYPPLAAGSALFVPAPLLERAREILAAQISDEELIAQAEAYQPPEDA